LKGYQQNSACENIARYKRIVLTVNHVAGKHGIMKIILASKSFKDYATGNNINKRNKEEGKLASVC